jgi:creatinine amidohydrolase
LERFVTRSYILAEANQNQVRDRKIEVAVLPWGATEPHNLHLPYGNDTLTVTRIGELICQRAYEAGAGVCLLPSIPFGCDANLMKFPMTINMNPTTQLAVARDVVESLKAHDVHKLVLLNGHGGNEFGIILRELYGCGVFITSINWWEVSRDVCEHLLENRGGEHADEVETSWALHLYPELVAPLDTADEGAVHPTRFEAMNKGWARISRPWDRLTTNSGHGNPHKATAEKGREWIDVAVDRLSKFLVELAEAETDETFPMA